MSFWFYPVDLKIPEVHDLYAAKCSCLKQEVQLPCPHDKKEGATFLLNDHKIGLPRSFSSSLSLSDIIISRSIDINTSTFASGCVVVSCIAEFDALPASCCFIDTHCCYLIHLTAHPERGALSGQIKFIICLTSWTSYAILILT